MTDDGTMHRGFDVTGMLAAFGRLWLHDHGCRSLVAVDLRTGHATVAADLGPEPTPDLARWPTVPLAPSGLLATGSALWLACHGALRRIDPRSGLVADACSEGTGWFCANQEAIYGLSDRPDRVLTRLDASDGSRRERSWSGYVRVGAATERHLWLVDRTSERLVRLAADSLQEQWSYDFAGGEVTHLFPAGDGVIVVHNRDLADGILVSNIGILNRSRVYRASTDGGVTQVGEIGIERVLAYDGSETIWIGRFEDGPDPDLRRDPSGRLACLDVRTGALQPHPTAQVRGQVDRIAAAGGQLYVAGFQRSRQRDALWRIDGTHVQRIDLGGLGLRFDPPAVAADEPDRQLTAGQLAAEIRSQLTRHGERFDDRADRWVDAGPSIHRAFTLREVQVEEAPPRVTVTFDWAAEPGIVFGFDFDADWLAQENAYGTGLPNAPDNIWLFALEELNTGLMTRAPRERRGEVTWISTWT